MKRRSRGRAISEARYILHCRSGVHLRPGIDGEVAGKSQGRYTEERGK